MHGKVVVITGATSGIGRIAPEALAAQGARIVLVARDEARAESVVARLREVAHRAHIGDLLSLADTKRVGDRIAAEESRIDVLINNAGNIFARRALTADGMERTFALNHMAYFLLTNQLRDRLVASAPAGAVTTTRSMRRRRSNSRTMRPASIVFPSPTSSAMRRFTRGRRSALRSGSNWYESSLIPARNGA
jgi:NAD(P)-dependent dehydrogenase (short-subunit alcohol dehydrogenase family)